MSGPSPQPVDLSNAQVQEENQFSCKFCTKKFRSSQALGGHQNAHKKERNLLKMKKEQEMNASGFRPTNVPLQARTHLYDPYTHSYNPNVPFQTVTPFCDPYSHSHTSNSNLPLQTWTPLYNGSYMHPMAPPSFDINEGFSFVTPPWKLNPETVHSLPESESKSLVAGSSSRVGSGFGDLQGSPSVSTRHLPSKVLDLSLKL